MYYYNGSVYVEDEDQCQTCANFAKGVACPLLQALGMGLVVMQDSMVVTNCGFYKEFKRHLRLISKNEPPEDNDNSSPDDKVRKFK
jgi:hypothetical protein